LGINDAGHAVGESSDGVFGDAVEWSNGSVINLGGLPGFTGSSATAINNAEQIVGISVFNGVDHATEWSDGNIINLEGLPGFTSSFASGINDAGQVVGYSDGEAVEWSGGDIIDLGPGVALGINDAGQVVGQIIINGLGTATEWSDGDIIGLGGLPRFIESSAAGINDVGQAVGTSRVGPPLATPEPSTWALMLVGFASLGYAGYRRARGQRAAV
jgi:probable HAF family extracellular repeat protein